MQVHPPLDPSGYDAFLVMVEAIPGLLMDEPVKGLEMLVSDEAVGESGNHAGGVKFEYLPGDLLGREHAVHLSRADGRQGHRGELGRRRVLDEDGPARGSYRVHATGAVGSGAGEDDGDGPLNHVFGQGVELVDGEMHMLMGTGSHAKDTFFDPDLLGRWTEIELPGRISGRRRSPR